jgi:hypothetical protein
MFRNTVILLIIFIVAGLPKDSNQISADDAPLQVFQTTKQGHNISVGVQPHNLVVGSAHFIINIVDLERSKPVSNATIKIVAVGPKGLESFKSPALSNPRDQDRYQANLTFTKPGTWTILIEIKLDIPEIISLEIPLEVKNAPRRPTTAGNIIWISVILIVLFGSIYIWASTKRTKH